MSEDICRICGNKSGNKLHHAREMFIGRRDVFTYIECAACGTLQIREVPNLQPYYSEDYYSLRPPDEPGETEGAGIGKLLARRVGAFVRRRAAAYYCHRRRPMGEFSHPLGRYLAKRGGRVLVGFPDYLKDTRLDLGLSTDCGVLDVGSGAGSTLVSLSHFGFRDLVGVDPFLPSNIVYENGVRVLKAEVSELDRQFDLILANHSLEHVPDPRQTLGDIRRILKPKRYAIVRLPVVASAWREYGVNWVQLDAPRHFFLFPVRTFKALAEEVGFTVDEVVYDSTAFQFWGSEQYARDVPLMDERSQFINPGNSIFTADEIAAFTARADELNRLEEGDQAVFYLRKV